MNQNVKNAMEAVTSFKNMEADKINSYKECCLEKLLKTISIYPEDFKYMPQSREVIDSAIIKLPANAQYVDWSLFDKEELWHMYEFYLGATSGEVFGWLPEDVKENEGIQKLAVMVLPKNIVHVKNQSDTLQQLAIDKDPTSVLYCTKVKDHVIISCIKRKWKIIKDLKEQKETYQIAAIEASPMAYDYITEPTDVVKVKFKELYGDTVDKVLNSEKIKNEDLRSYEIIPALKDFAEKELVDFYDRDVNAPDTLTFFYNGYLLGYYTDLYTPETQFPVANSKVRLFKDFIEMWNEQENMTGEDIIVIVNYEDLEPWREKGTPFKFVEKDIYPYTIVKPYRIEREGIQDRFVKNILHVLGFDDNGDEYSTEEQQKHHEYIAENYGAVSVDNRFIVKSYHDAWWPFESNNEEGLKVCRSYENSYEAMDNCGDPWTFVYITNVGKLVYISWYKYALRSAYCNVPFTEELLTEMENTAKEIMK